jgi:hypothetical protein
MSFLPVSEDAALGRIHFHHAAHDEWADRQLHFWFLRAKSVYERDQFRRKLKDVARQLRITSYATYELIGAYDLMIRMYLKAAETREFREALYSQLAPKTQYTFRVEEVARHWVWAKHEGDRGPIHEPTADVLSRRYPRSELALLNEQENAGQERRSLIDRYAALDLVREVVPADGIKIVVMIGFDEQPGEEQLAQIRDRLCKWLDRTDKRIYERSLYVADASQKQQFLLMCRLAHRDFHQIREWLIEKIGDQVGALATQTVTYPVVSKDFVCFQERIDLPAERRPDVTSLMLSNEGWQFEVKGSLLAPLDPWLKEGKELQEQPGWPLKSVLKGIVGLLNSGGGTMVIGALEERFYTQFPSALERLGGFPELGPYRIIGLLDPTYTQVGWDAWHSNFKSLLQGKISPAPGVLVHAREGELEGRPVCIVDVDEPQEDASFWLRETQSSLIYYARVGTSCEPLHGPDADSHRENMRQHRRSKRGG